MFTYIMRNISDRKSAFNLKANKVNVKKYRFLKHFGKGLLLNVPDLENALVTPDYVNGELIAMDVSWFVLLCLWVIFAIVKLFRRRVWPSLYSKKEKVYLAGQNDRYVEALKEASEVLVRCQKSVPLFAPAHELKSQILKINALCREAEYYNELLHPTLQDALQVS